MQELPIQQQRLHDYNAIRQFWREVLFQGLYLGMAYRGGKEMAKRTHYRIHMTFTYSNGDTGGVLETTVNSHKAVAIQLEANRAWLAIKGATETSVEVTPIN